MKLVAIVVGTACVLGSPLSASAQAPEACGTSGPQTPRDITSKDGTNTRQFPLAVASTALNLCRLPAVSSG